MTATQVTKAQLEAQIKTLENEWVLVLTNNGTFGNGEAVDAVGTSDPAFCVCRRYETVGGTVKVENKKAENLGRMRDVGTAELGRKRAELNRMKNQLKAM